jgi:flagellar biosynthesis protein FlhF
VSETRTYLGESLESLLPQIREELGSDAIVVRQREGIVGGVGGFFGKRCIEVEAQAVPARVRVSALPARAVIDAYDTGEEMTSPSRVFETLLAQAEPFVPAGEAEWDGEWDWQAPPSLPPVPVAALEPEHTMETAPSESEPEPAMELEIADVPASLVPVQTLLEQLGPIENDDYASIRTEMLAAALPVRLVGEILADVEQHLVPFEPGASRRSLTRRALAGRIKTANGWRTKQRTVAVVGFAGSGRTLTTASLATAYAAAGKSVAALSLEPAREAMRLADLLGERREIEFEIVDAPARVRSARKRITADIIVADTPPAEGDTLRSTLSLLRALEPDETHLVMPSGVTAVEGQAMINTLAAYKLPTRIIVSHTDDQRSSGAAVGLAVAHKIPVSFIGQSSRVGRLQPAEPDALARMVLR